MKKTIIGLAFLVIIGGAGYKLYDDNYGTSDYYTKIYTDGERVENQIDTGGSFHRYKYNLKFINSNKDIKELEFESVKDKPLKSSAYLKAKINPKKGVIGWEEVTDVPKEIKTEVDSFS